VEHSLPDSCRAFLDEGTWCNCWATLASLPPWLWDKVTIPLASRDGVAEGRPTTMPSLPVWGEDAQLVVKHPHSAASYAGTALRL
jgi:hypothetical protein